jgi:hypothetical protein
MDPNQLECCGNCGWGLCYVDHITGEADEGYAIEYSRGGT